MDVKLSYWAALTFSLLALVLAVANISLSTNNRAMQANVAARQNAIAEADTFSKLNQSLVQAMADAAYRNNNAALRDLLASQGITMKAAPPADAATADKPAAKK